MYDGIKIECALSDRRKWENSLALIGRHAESTGEVLPLPSDCKLHGCTFSRVPTNNKPLHIVQGSLHRFYKKGGENNDDYTLLQVTDTINRLESDFGINPAKSKVINFEFGVNIKLPPGVDAQDFQKYVVSAYSKGFEKLNPRRPAVGYIAEFNEFSIKVYDKGFQSQTDDRNLLRIEIKVNRTRWLDQYKFEKGKDLYLTDLLKKSNIRILGDILENKVRSLILTPRKIDISKLSQKQRQTFYECRDARSWEEWTSKQRERKRAQLAIIFKKVDQPNPVDVLAKLVAEKWQELTTTPALVAHQKQRQKVTFSSFIVCGFRGLFNLLKGQKLISVYVSLLMLHRPRGEPLPRPPTPIVLKGVTKWVDLRIRPPPRICFE